MTKAELKQEIVNRLKGQKKTLAEISAEIKGPKKTIKDTILMLVSEGIVSEEDDHYVLSEGTVPQIDLSDTDWKVINHLQSLRGKNAKLDDVAKMLGKDAADASVSKLVDAGILVQRGWWYKITAASAMLIPLNAEERESLRAAENRINELVGEIYPKQLEVAGELRKIRDTKLYRESHKRFEDYVLDRFERTRDWAYKLIRDLEVADGLIKVKAMPDVETFLQNVTARDMPHLAKLKKEPEKSPSLAMMICPGFMSREKSQIEFALRALPSSLFTNAFVISALLLYFNKSLSFSQFMLMQPRS